jgi:hypothetical protein
LPAIATGLGAAPDLMATGAAGGSVTASSCSGGSDAPA